MEEDTARYRAAQLLEKPNQIRQNALCAPFYEEPRPNPTQEIEGEFYPLSEEFARTTGFPPKPSEAGSAGEGGAA